MKQKYDLIVVGAGPAGLMAAQTAAKGGLNVLLIERKTNVSAIGRTCVAGLMTEPDTHGETVTVEGNRIVFHRNDFSIQYNGLWKDIKACYYISPAGNRIRMEREATYVTRIFNKEVLLEDLLAESEKSEVHIAQGTEAIRVENVNDGVLAVIRGNGEEKEIWGRFAIAADGVNSRIVENLGLNKKRKQFATMAITSYILEGVEPAYPEAFIAFVGRGQMEGCKGQVNFCPRPSRNPQDPPLWEIMYGQPVEVGEKSPEELLNRFIKKGNFSSWFNHARVIRKTAGVLNSQTPIQEPRVGNILVLGDAASFMQVTVQSAIMYAYQCAKAIIKEMNGESALEEYVEYWKSTFEYLKPEIMDKIVRGAYGIHVLEDGELDYLFGLTDSKSYKGYYSEFSIPGVIQKAITAEVPRIMQEKPELIQKIQNLFEKASIEETYLL